MLRPPFEIAPAREVAGELFYALAFVGCAMHACVQAEALRVGAQFTRAMRYAQLTSACEGEHFAPCAWPGCDTVTR